MNRPFSISPTGDPLKSWRRAVVVEAVASISGRNVEECAMQLYGAEAKSIARGAVAPASAATAGALVGERVGAFLRSLRPKSAAAELIARSPRYDATSGPITLPGLATDFPPAIFVAEGGVAPAFSGSLATVVLAPRKLMAITALTGELAAYSAEVAEQVLADLLETAAARALDAALFSATAASELRPAGILAGISATAGTAGGGQAALAADLKTLAAAVADAGGGGNLIIIAAPGQAISLKVLAGVPLDLPVISAPILAAGTVIVLDTTAFASGFSSAQIEIVDSATLHMEDTAPLAIGTAGSPATVAAPTRSSFQSDLKVLRLILRVSFVMRAPAIAFTTSATW